MHTFFRTNSIAGLVVRVVMAACLLSCGFNVNAAWYKGNTHSHSQVGSSDACSWVTTIGRWYRDHGFHFVVLTDHNDRTDITNAQTTLDQETANGKPSFKYLWGEEHGSRWGTENLPIHITGLNTTARCGPNVTGTSKRNMLQKLINNVNSNNGLAFINHPNGHWALNADDMHAMTNCNMFEVWNSSAGGNLGDATHLSTEEIWDNLMSRTGGRIWYGVGSDDGHCYAEPVNASIGASWVMVQASSLTGNNIEAAMRAGSFYSSTGVTYNTITRSNNTISCSIAGVSGRTYTTQFIGKNGAILATSTSLNPTFTISPTHHYLRAKTIDSTGKWAWIQPIPYTAPSIVNDSPVMSSNWSTSSFQADKYGPEYSYRPTAAVSDPASWTITVPSTGTYEIHAWWAQHSNRSKTAPYILPDGTTVKVNQQTNGGKWNLLGTKTLTAGNQTVQLSCWTTTGYFVLADAIKIVGPK